MELKLECIVLCVEGVSQRFKKNEIFEIFCKYGHVVKYGYFKSIPSTIYIEYQSKSDTMIALEDDYYLGHTHGLTVSLRIRSYRKRFSQDSDNHKTAEDQKKPKVEQKISSFPNIETCALCESFYCNNRCFTKNWIEKHVKKLGLKSILQSKQYKEQIEELNKMNLFNGSMVYITYNRDYRKCYIRSASDKDDAKFRKLINSVDKHSKNAECLSAIPNVGRIVAAPYFERYYRARVIYANPKTGDVQVEFIDFGNKSTMKYSKLKHLKPKYTGIRPMAIKISLKFVDKMPANVELSCKNFLRALTAENSILVLFYDVSPHRNQLKCELYLSDSKVSINHQLNDLNDAKSMRLQTLWEHD